MNETEKLKLMEILNAWDYKDSFIFGVLLQIEKGFPMGEAIMNQLRIDGQNND